MLFGRSSVKEMIKIAIFSSLLCVSAFFSAPVFFVPVTLQTLILFIISLVLKPKSAFFSVLVYILIGFVGFPVFAGFKGGPAHLFGPTGGYIFSFLLAAPLISYLKKYFLLLDRFLYTNAFGNTFIYMLCCMVGATLIHITGALYYSFIASVGIKEAFLTGSVCFIIADLIKSFFAGLIIAVYTPLG